MRIGLNINKIAYILSMIKLLNDHIVDILSKNEDKISIALKQRAKFEGWLKLELAYKLLQSYSDVKIEFPYPCNNRKHADIYASNALIELKTPNTNYHADNCVSCIRPITKNIESIIDDINKLQEFGGQYKKYISFVLFPVDVKEGYKEYIQRINNTGVVLEDRSVVINEIPILVCSAEVVLT